MEEFTQEELRPRGLQLHSGGASPTEEFTQGELTQGELTRGDFAHGGVHSGGTSPTEEFTQGELTQGDFTQGDFNFAHGELRPGEIFFHGDRIVAKVKGGSGIATADALVEHKLCYK